MSHDDDFISVQTPTIKCFATHNLMAQLSITKKLGTIAWGSLCTKIRDPRLCVYIIAPPPKTNLPDRPTSVHVF